MAEMDNKNRKDGNPCTYYILLKDGQAKKRPKGYSTSTAAKKAFLLKGEILYRNRVTAVDKGSSSIQLRPYSMESYVCECSVEDVKRIDEEEARLLLSISSMDKRFQLYKDNSVKNGKLMSIGTNIYVKVPSLNGGQQELKGVVKYKGPLPGELGTMFGVELEEGKGRGTTDGNFRGKRYFRCNPDCGVFVSFERVRLCEVKDAAEDNSSSMFTKVKNKIVDLVLGEQTPEGHSLEKLDKMCAGHQVDDRVWVYIGDKVHAGSIKYIGRLPGGKGILAGIEMDNPVGEGNGEYYGKQLFNCPMNHAHFTPIQNVITTEKFHELYGQLEDAKLANSSTSKGTSLSTLQTATDIVNMESNFSKKSREQVIKEQERLLQKIKDEEKQKMAEKQESRGGTRTSLDEKWKSKNENQSKSNHVSQVTFQVNSHQRGPRSPTSMNYPQMANIPTLDVGSMVEVLSKNQNPKYGVIRWVGFLPNSDKKIAGLELEEEMDACTDGTFIGRRFFTCPNRRGFFVHLHNCMPDSRFNRSSIENPASKRLTAGEFGPYHSEIIEHDSFIPPPETLDAYLKEGPQGIQGHHNSCYLDATLFAAFSFSSVMDSILLRPRNDKDIEEYEKVQAVLRNNIVYPLRHSGFVRADRVLELRQLLDRLGTVEGLVGEEKDPEEFLLTLLQQVLKSEPFLKIKSGRVVRNEYFYQVLADKDVERVLPSVEELLKKSFHQSELKLTEVPSCLIVQMPRFGKGFKMYDRILPSLTINIGELVDNSPQDCVVCGRLALYHCRDCFSVTGSEDKDSSGNFCKECHERVHSHTKRAKHKVQPIAVSREICSSYSNKPVEHRVMELFAVICIETSHYVSFVKCEEPSGEVKWCFFDSMADRIGTKKGYNVPSVTECPEIIEWLSSEKQNRERIINTSDKEMPDKVRRLLGDAYVCLYESKEMAMYK